MALVLPAEKGQSCQLLGSNKFGEWETEASGVISYGVNLDRE